MCFYYLLLTELPSCRVGDMYLAVKFAECPDLYEISYKTLLDCTATISYRRFPKKFRPQNHLRFCSIKCQLNRI